MGERAHYETRATPRLRELKVIKHVSPLEVDDLCVNSVYYRRSRLNLANLYTYLHVRLNIVEPPDVAQFTSK